MHCFSSSSRLARKNHRCTCCGQRIYKGELYLTWSNVDGCFFTNKAHHECYELIHGEYELYEFERPDHRLTNYGLLLMYQQRGWATSKVLNYQRPVLTIGHL